MFKIYSLLVFLMTFSLAVTAEEKIANLDMSEITTTSELKFMLDAYDVKDVITAPTFPKEDVHIEIFKDKKGVVNASYILIGQSKDFVDLGSFANNKTGGLDGGTTCDGSLSCGRAINQCLKGGEEGRIRPGKCNSTGQEYCVTCHPL